jgi:hypothetical protein
MPQSKLILLNKEQICFTCGKPVKKGKIAVAHARSGQRRHAGRTDYYHPEHFAYANGEPVFNIEDENIRRYGLPPIRVTAVR